MSNVKNNTKNKNGKVDGIFAVGIVFCALAISGLNIASAQTETPAPAQNNIHEVVTTSGAGGENILISGSAGLTLDSK